MNAVEANKSALSKSDVEAPSNIFLFNSLAIESTEVVSGYLEHTLDIVSLIF